MFKKTIYFFIFIVLVIGSCTPRVEVGSKEYYQKKIKKERTNNLIAEEKIDGILANLTLEEKAGQMLHINLAGKSPFDTLGFDININKKRLIEITRKFGIGFIICDIGLSAEKWLEYMEQLQNIYLNESRSKVPFIFAICHQHGPTYVADATIFPHNINLAATFDTIHAYNCAFTTSLETAHLGHNFNYVPVMDLGRNPRWSRFYETFGESYLVGAEMGKSVVRGVQDNAEVLPFKAAACAKHFIGYSDPKSGWDRTPAHIPDQELYEFFVPPFQACIDAGVKIIEANSGEVNGIPVHASYDLLTTLLRDKMGFSGVLNSDYEDIKRLVTHHGVAENEKEATYLGLRAGIDCVLTANDALFAKYTCELVREGRIPEERLDMSVKRILRLKYDLGLFSGNFCVQDKISENLNRNDSQQKSLEAARESIVLLKNQEHILPLIPEKIKKIVLAGPNANLRKSLAGGWTVGWSNIREEDIPARVKTIYQSVIDHYPQSNVVLANDEQQISTYASGADAIIYVAGEDTYAEIYGSITDMNLPEKQLVEINTAVKSGVPTIVIMVAGRPRIVTSVYDKLDAFVWAGLPGYMGAEAIVEILSGKVNPSGKLPFEYPVATSMYMNYNRKKHEEVMIKDVKKAVSLASFGDGLSYTTFEYKNLKITDTIIGSGKESVVTVDVTNKGKMTGKESVLWFITDEHGTITRPVKELKHFEKYQLMPGESKTVEFRINPEKHLSFPDKNGVKRIENGRFRVQVGKHKKGIQYNSKNNQDVY